MCIVKGTRINPAVTPTPIFRATHHHRPIEGPSLQIMVDQLSGLTSNFSNMGLNPIGPTNSTFSLAGKNLIPNKNTTVYLLF